MKRESILYAITSAVNHLENSMKALLEKNEEELMKKLWRPLADLEYALFLFSLRQQDEPLGSLREHAQLDRLSKKFEIAPSLALAKDLLKKAKESFEADKINEAHQKTWLARGHLLRVHEFFEKKQRKGKKHAS